MKSTCHISFGSSAAKQMKAAFGFFFGSEMINPARCNVRQMVAGETVS